MIFYKRIYFLLTFFTSCSLIADAQDRPIGYWRSHLPYNSAVGVATDGNILFTACKEAFFTFNATSGYSQIEAYSKVEGMSDLGMQCISYDATTSTVILVYTDGNIDLFKESQNTFYNIPDLKIKSVSGDKTVNQVYTENGIAYVCTSLGILVIDLATHNITENYQFTINNQITPIYGFIGSDSNFYAVTSHGLYSAAKNNPQLQNFQVWRLVDSNATFRNISSVNNTLFLSNSKSVYTLVNDTLHKVYTITDVFNIQHIDAGISSLIISEFDAAAFAGKVKLLDNSFHITDSFYHLGNIMQAVQMPDSSIWVADAYSGLKKIIDSTSIASFTPQGPSDIGCFDIYANNKNVWVAHGGNDGIFAQGKADGVSNFNGTEWQQYKWYVYPPFNNTFDYVSVAKDELTGTVYMGSFQNGLFTLNKDGSYELLNKNSIFDTSIIIFGGDQRQVDGLALDKSGNLWVSTIASQHQLYVKTAEGNWHKFLIPGVPNGGPIVVDDNGQVWIASMGGGGVVVYDAKGTFDSTLDDSYYNLTTGVGNGNLPSNTVYCLVKDKRNNIWAGTSNGIGIISNCSAPGPCDAQIPTVQYDQFAGYLFAGSNVRTIAVDGADRKWVGTDEGVWLLSSNAEKIVYRFTEDNSPLPSNHVRKIAVDKVTGDVYIGTDKGMISYRSTATDGGTSNQSVEVFPNPVKSGYSGNIAIKGLVANADVRITDIDGQLVYRTTAFGGQAVWNGMDYTGHRPQSGVYLVFISSADGNQKYTAKIVFMQ